MRRFWHSRAVRILFVILFVSLCLLAHLEYRMENLLKEAEEAKEAIELERRVRNVLSSRLPTPDENDISEGKENADLRTKINENVKDIFLQRMLKDLKTEFEGVRELPSQSRKDRFKYTFKVKNGIQELWWHLRARLKKMKDSTSISDIDKLLEDMSHQEKSILTDVDRLEELDMDWKLDTAKKLGTLIQNRLHHLQNPKNCNTARKLVCSLGEVCGFGCYMHRVMYCFILAYGTRRTLVIQSGGWSYSSGKGWGGAFLPVSDTCTTAAGAVKWAGDHQDKQVVSVPLITSLEPRPPFLPPAIPTEFADKLLSFHGHPFVWFAGQFLRYLMRPNKKLGDFIAKQKKALKIKKPYVGVQVRRTDKIHTEAAFHRIDEYMVHVEEWYQKQRMTHHIEGKRVFIATDDPTAIREARTKYPDYEVFGDEGVAQSAHPRSRYSLNSLFGVAFDVYTLAESEYVVCTFSSNLCRLSYELMQTYHVDASQKYYSLDEMYYYTGQQDHEVKALYSQTAEKQGQIEMQVGDLVGIAGNEKDGTSKGKNRRTSAYGEYLSYKVEEVPVIAEFSTYNSDL